MAILSWGKPKIEISKLDESGDATTWIEIDTPVENSTQLIPEKGEKREAKEEGGKVVDSRTSANKYRVEFELYAKKGKSKPIEDNDGVVEGNYAFRLTPEDPSLVGFIIENNSVSVEDTFTSADGEKWKYTFEGLKPKNGNIKKPYTA